MPAFGIVFRERPFIVKAQASRPPARAFGQRAAFLVVLAGLGAACGNGSSSTGTTTPPTPVPANGPAVTLSSPLLTLASATDVQTVTVTSSGTDVLTISDVTAVGNFAQTNTCGVLQVGDTCTISVSFVSAIATNGALSTGSVLITDDATTSPQSVSLSGPVVSAATASLSPRGLTFATQPVGTTSVPQVVSLSNILNGPATVDLRVLGIQATDDFQIVQNGCGSTVPAGSSCQMSVAFTPTAAGPRSGTLAVNVIAPVGLAVVGLSGTGQ